MHTNIRRSIVLGVVFAALPMSALAQDAPHAQRFRITAYYSPLPNQCCYVKGGLVADKVLNGQGTNGADGTPVFPGMIAAPPSYPFGTKVELPGLGVFEVRDRGGAIQEQGAVHRLDIWIGHGEEGLARALNFGVQEIEGTIYPVGSAQPQTSFSFDVIPATPQRIENYLIEKANLLALRPKQGDTNLSTQILQEYLSQAGYLQHAVTGFFGDVTRVALQAFLGDYALDGSPETLTEKAAAYLLSAVHRRGAKFPISGYVDAGSSESTVQAAQRTLRFLGYYRGRTDGEYNDVLAQAILKFQQDHLLVGTAEDPGAGRIGPITSKTMEREWNKALVAQRAEKLLLLNKVDTLLAQRGDRIEQFLGEGYSGDQVRLLQELLVQRGYFPEEEVNGNFGPLTKEAVVRYQLATGLIKSAKDQGAGYVGPSTMAQLREEQKKAAYRLVRGQGIGVL